MCFTSIENRKLFYLRLKNVSKSNQDLAKHIQQREPAACAVKESETNQNIGKQITNSIVT